MSNAVNRMPRGLIPTPQDVIASARKFTAADVVSPPPHFLRWPLAMSYWGNNTYSDCVSAEEAFAKAAANPHLYIPDASVVGWARRHGFLNGAGMLPVMAAMKNSGIELNMTTVFDGDSLFVDFRNQDTLVSAIYSFGPVKLGVGSGKFKGGSGVKGGVSPGKSGWTLCNYPAGEEADHCVSLCGYGTFGELSAEFKSHGVNVKAQPEMQGRMCYALFTWNSIGIVDEQSLLNMTYEAWVRNPVTPDVSFPKASGFRLKNDGGFVADIHALYRSSDSVKCSEAANRDNFPIGQTKTMSLAEKCTNPAINLGDIVQFKAWIRWGKDNTSSMLFTYDPQGPVQSFRISGATRNNSIQYLGTC